MSTEITEQVLYRKKVEEQSRIIEEQKKHLEKVLEDKDEFFSVISHDFKTPLNVIITAIQAMNNICGNELPEKAKKYVGMIKMNTFRQLRLVNNLLDITRVDTGNIKINKKNINIVFLTKAIVESVQTYAAQKNIDLMFICPFENKIIGIDDEKYERILLNLLSNAIKFSPESRSIVVKLISKKNKVNIEVKDYGIGIPEDKKAIIFEKFGQVDSSLSRRAEGSGIGLSLVKRFVVAMGGCISVKSKMRKGSTFIVQLPDETVTDEGNDNEVADLLDNRLIQSTKVEFSDIYF